MFKTVNFFPIQASDLRLHFPMSTIQSATVSPATLHISIEHSTKHLLSGLFHGKVRRGSFHPMRSQHFQHFLVLFFYGNCYIYIYYCFKKSKPNSFSFPWCAFSLVFSRCLELTKFGKK